MQYDHMLQPAHPQSDRSKPQETDYKITVDTYRQG